MPVGFLGKEEEDAGYGMNREQWSVTVI